MPRGQHPNSLANLKRGKKFGPGDDPVKKKGREKAAENKRFEKSFRSIAEEVIEADDGKIKRALVTKLLKLGLEEGNLGALEYVIKLCGEDPDHLFKLRPPEEKAASPVMQALTELIRSRMDGGGDS